MGMVLSFVPRNSASSHRPNTAGELAPVIMFPGVRYERLNAGGAARETEETAAAVQKPATKKPAH